MKLHEEYTESDHLLLGDLVSEHRWLSEGGCYEHNPRDDH
jgi:hypothetical protein